MDGAISVSIPLRLRQTFTYLFAFVSSVSGGLPIPDGEGLVKDSIHAEHVCKGDRFHGIRVAVVLTTE
jgi:hypothetical protein